MRKRGLEITRRELLAGAGALAAATAVPAAAQTPPRRGGTLQVATVDKPVNMDPGYAQLYSSLQVYQNVYSKLVYVDDQGGFQPGLARSWKQDGDKTWMFDLADNAVFHNGEPLTSKDVVFTFNRLLDADNKFPMRVFFTPVASFRKGTSQVPDTSRRWRTSNSAAP